MKRMLCEFGLPKSAIVSLDQFDWSLVKAKLILSIPRNYLANEASEIGYLQLSKEVSSLVEECQDELQLEYQSSSCGKLSIKWLSDLCFEILKMPATDSVPIKLIFPSLLTVIDSEVGMGGFGAVFCREKDFKSKLFPRQNFYDCVSRIPGTCTHTKVTLLFSM